MVIRGWVIPTIHHIYFEKHNTGKNRGSSVPPEVDR